MPNQLFRTLPTCHTVDGENLCNDLDGGRLTWPGGNWLLAEAKLYE
jgi:hypothetical protein